MRITELERNTVLKSNTTEPWELEQLQRLPFSFYLASQWALRGQLSRCVNLHSTHFKTAYL